MADFDFKTMQAKPEWLTSVLTKNGFLTKGEVSSIHQEPIFDDRAFFSDFFSLKIEYSESSQGGKPVNIIMKMVKPEYYIEKEINLYESLVDLHVPLPLLKCFGTAKSPATKQGYMLLEDLRQTHDQPQMPLPPVYVQCEEAIKALANVHGYWWNHQRFGESQFMRPSKHGLRALFKAVEDLYAKFADFMADRLTTDRRKIYEIVFDKLPDLLWSRLASPERLTLYHGDAHFWNFLYPNNKDQNPCVLFDWQGWGVGLGALDLAYMIALWCYPEHRQRIELPLLKSYYAELQKQEIEYGWDELQTDYRIGAIGLIFHSIQMHFSGAPPVWPPRLERALAAFDDLNCIELL